MSLYTPSGGFTGTPDPLRWADAQANIAAARQAAGGASLDLWPEADFAFVDPLNGDPTLYEAFEDLATVIRASKSFSSDWSGVNGDPVGTLIEHDSGKPSWSPYGLRAAPAVENRISNARGEGGAIPAVPSAWDVGGTATITLTARGVEDGWPYVEFTINGSGSAYATPGYPSAANGEVLTASVGLALRSGSVTSVQRLGFATNSATSGFVELTADAIHRRWAATSSALSGATTIAGLAVTFTEGVYTSAVFRIFAPVLTLSNWPTPVVLPPVGTPGASVKAADVVSVAPGGWYRHDAGTLVIDFDRPPIRSAGIYSLMVNTLFGRTLRLDGAGVLNFDVAIEAGGGNSGLGPTLAAGRHVAVFSWTGRNHNAAIDGVSVTPWSSTGDVLPPETFAIGRGGHITSNPSGTVFRRLRFFPRELTQAEREEISTPYWSA